MAENKDVSPDFLLQPSQQNYEARVKSDEFIRHMVAIIESSDDAIISKSLDGVIKSWNKGAEKMFGFSASEAVGHHISLIIPPENIEEERLILKKVCNNEVIDHYETQRIKRNGERIFVSITASPLKNKDGKIIGVSKIARDISVRKKAEAEIRFAQQQLAEQHKEKELRAAELRVANDELLYQNQEKEKRAAELWVANKELVFQSDEKENRAAELLIANQELIFQNKEKEKRADELIVANKELAFQNKEKGKRADELVIANNELAFQNDEKGKRADELIVANRELAFQNEEKEMRASELFRAVKELAFQNEEKGKRAEELIIANKELAFQNLEKEKRADELVIANRELAFQNEEKELRASELLIAVKELASKEVALKKHNKELDQFAYIASHDLQEPLRTVGNYMKVFAEDYLPLLDEKALSYLDSVNRATDRMSKLIKSLLEFSRLGNNSKVSEVDCSVVLGEVISDLAVVIERSNATIEISDMPVLNLYEIEIRQLFQNLITNAIKFHKKDIDPIVTIYYARVDDVNHFSVADNGIGIDAAHFERAFEIFQRLPESIKYEGNGIGLANCKKIVQLHQGEIRIESTLNEGSTIHFTIGNLPVL